MKRMKSEKVAVVVVVATAAMLAGMNTQTEREIVSGSVSLLVATLAFTTLH